MGKLDGKVAVINRCYERYRGGNCPGFHSTGGTRHSRRPTPKAVR
jgi:hypothetical protein